MSEREPKTLHDQLMIAFSGYSVGGAAQPTEDGKDRVFYVERSTVEKRPDWEAAIKRLNASQLLGGVSRVEVVDTIPIREVYATINGRVQAITKATSPLELAALAAAR